MTAVSEDELPAGSALVPLTSRDVGGAEGGAGDGAWDGALDGALDGAKDGAKDGAVVWGAEVGNGEVGNAGDGAKDGAVVGAGVGDAVGRTNTPRTSWRTMWHGYPGGVGFPAIPAGRGREGWRQRETEKIMSAGARLACSSVGWPQYEHCGGGRLSYAVCVLADYHSDSAESCC